MLRVGRVVEGRYQSYPGFSDVVVTTASSAYGALSPFCLQDEKGRYHENIWQASKLYPYIPATEQTYSRWDKRVIWRHDTEIHTEAQGGTLVTLPAYWAWRQKLLMNPYPVRYPVGYHHRHHCICSFRERPDGTIDPTPLDYVAARKQIYVPEYIRLVRKHPLFASLQQRLQAGENLLTLDVDGPHEESMPYYRQKYGVHSDFITRGSVLATPEHLELLLNDTKHPYSHGYALCEALRM